ncbi:MAG TPA: bifunctional chorismate mutase/prephenate dehydratase [Vicinamibacterales bacterium]|nr:bifunctional chorismate mutase/prephenate dehydratase [Vicinamibacterales bacterium]
MTMRDLADLRKALDDLDKVLLHALSERTRLAREVAGVKAGAEHPVRDLDRESALVAHRAAYGEGLGLDPALVRRIYGEILEDSVRRQHDWLRTPVDAEAAPWAIAYQGTEGAYGHEAAQRHFGVERRLITFRPYRSFREALEAVQAGDAQRAVLPIENSTAGSVHEVYDLLFRLNLAMVGEEVLPIRHCLLGVPRATIAGLTHVHSHPQALAQCSDYLAGLAAVEIEPAANTAVAAARVAERGDPAHGAIASAEAGDRHGLTVLARDIANQAVNLTRFVVVAAAPIDVSPLVACKVSLVFGTRHERGALVRCLNVLAEEGLSMSKLESRPRPGAAWEYVFYVDVEGHLSEPRVQSGLAGLATATQFVRVLGCYPQAVTSAGGTAGVPQV